MTTLYLAFCCNNTVNLQFTVQSGNGVCGVGIERTTYPDSNTKRIRAWRPLHGETSIVLQNFSLYEMWQTTLCATKLLHFSCTKLWRVLAPQGETFALQFLLFRHQGTCPCRSHFEKPKKMTKISKKRVTTLKGTGSPNFFVIYTFHPSKSKKRRKCVKTWRATILVVLSSDDLPYRSHALSHACTLKCNFVFTHQKTIPFKIVYIFVFWAVMNLSSQR